MRRCGSVWQSWRRNLAVLEPLLLRLCEWAADNLTDESARDWFGYVEPPLERARAALQTGLQCDEGTMGGNGS
jgi:hypothetical protein